MEKYAFTCKRRDSPQMTILSKLLYKFNENSIKTPVIFFLRRRKTNYKTYKKGQNGRKKSLEGITREDWYIHIFNYVSI
jgi:hypothetical protein